MIICVSLDRNAAQQTRPLELDSDVRILRRQLDRLGMIPGTALVGAAFIDELRQRAMCPNCHNVRTASDVTAGAVLGQRRRGQANAQERSQYN